MIFPYGHLGVFTYGSSGFQDKYTFWEEVHNLTWLLLLLLK